MFDGGIDIGGMLFAGREHSCNYFFAGECCKGKGTNKFLRRSRHDHLHTNAAVLQQADNLRRLVSRNTTRHSQSNFHRLLPPAPERHTGLATRIRMPAGNSDLFYASCPKA